MGEGGRAEEGIKNEEMESGLKIFTVVSGLVIRPSITHNVVPMSLWRRSDIGTTLLRCCVFNGHFLSSLEQIVTF